MTLADGSGLVLCAISSAQRAASMKRSSSRSASAVSPVVLSRDRTNESFRGLSELHESRLGFLAAGFDMHRAAQLMAGDVPCQGINGNELRMATKSAILVFISLLADRTAVYPNGVPRSLR